MKDVKRRIWGSFLAFLFVFVLITARLFYVQVVRHEFYRTHSEEQRKRIINLSADRGDILDARGSVMATSVDSYSVYFVPGEIKNKEYTARKISSILGMSYYSVLNMCFEKRPFVWVKRKIPSATADLIRAQKIKGVNVLGEKERVYPKGKLASQILGFVGMDNQGLSGIEFGLENYLKGREGRYITESDPRGRELISAVGREIQKPKSGMNVTLSIDEVVQYICERELEGALKAFRAVSGVVIVMDPRTGDILAMASKPDFDPNDYSKYPSRSWNLRAVQDVFEPGSTFKLVTIAAALNEGVIEKNTRINCPDTLSIGGRTIRNSHHADIDLKNASILEILAYSVNTGTSLIGIELGPEKLMKYIRAFGFGAHTAIGIPGETRGIVREPRTWSKPDIAMISFGQAIAVTPLQLAAAVSAIANNGVMMKPRLVKKIESPDGTYIRRFPEEELARPISEDTALIMKEFMKAAVDEGTGWRARVRGFSVGGKTGTAQKVRPGGRGYWPGHFIASFAGIVPVWDSKLVILVVIDEPKEVKWGEVVAAPVFSRVAEDILRYYNVAPDVSGALVVGN